MGRSWADHGRSIHAKNPKKFSFFRYRFFPKNYGNLLFSHSPWAKRLVIFADPVSTVVLVLVSLGIVNRQNCQLTILSIDNFVCWVWYFAYQMYFECVSNHRDLSDVQNSSQCRIRTVEDFGNKMRGSIIFTNQGEINKKREEKALLQYYC